MNHDLDETDLKILEAVEDDYERSLEELAEELDISKSTIHYRLNKLKENDVISTPSVSIDPNALGLNMLLITEVSVSHERGYADDIGDQLADIDGIVDVYYTMGDVDFVILARVQDRDQMNTLIDDVIAIEGVNETSSRFVMQEVETNADLMGTMSEEMRENVLDAE
ncbi:Lrp/AsnC family transcriptional regulator [Natronorubrum daqingense]|uniref:AsnC family transcriptional regulator n=1 Tax=Natronorubrum daqingense TaxID=588898 RepID=A0A1N7ES06_9EURY|nr:Lrp/AsnC family transcriptional regulator [Natronorubrum daqingense]APX97757.1 AsnC family transcriptional regulator [Natronorubrum daqingense]SIR90832.1 DNA-binding transcriptional regulator, Lrp family [Natronorubrum daqingense]